MGGGATKVQIPEETEPNNNTSKQNGNKTSKREKNRAEEEYVDTTIDELDPVDIPKTEDGYPPVRPPRDRKEDIFQANKMANIDTHARGTTVDRMTTFDDLILYLSTGCSTDIEKLRSIFIWMGTQNIMSTDNRDVKVSYTPRGMMRLVRANIINYAELFAFMCRKMGIPCLVIHGHCKAARYDVGDTAESLLQTNINMNLLYVCKGWRIVIPFWCFVGLQGHSLGKYTKVESKGVAVREKEIQSEGMSVSQINEDWFLPDPERLIYDVFPLNDRYQLLPTPWTFKKYIEVPYITQHFYDEQVFVTNKVNGTVHTVDGECHIELSCRNVKDMKMNYELFYNNEESGHEISGALQLNNFVFLNRFESKWNFGIRFPEVGVYKLKIVGGHSFETDICYFKIYCNEAQEDCKPLPVNPGTIGYGPSADTEKAGLKALSHQNGLVKVETRKQVEFSFNLTRILEIKTELVHTSLEREELESCIKQTKSGKKLKVQVTVPEKGEYALQVHTQQKGEASFKNVCNYLLTSEEDKRKKKKTRSWENPNEKKTRAQLEDLSKTKGTACIEDLEKAIEMFDKLDMEDKGDLAKAVNILELKKLQKELRDAINRRHIETLDKAITRGKESKHKEKLKPHIEEAEDVKGHLTHLKRIAHAILEMKQTTIAELKSYKYPQKIIEDIMRTTFLVLGEKKIDVEYWEDVQALMGKLGPKSLIRRVREFDTVNVQPDTVYYMDKVVTDYDEMDARQASAGAGTFYVWLRNVSEAITTEESKESNDAHNEEYLDNEDNEDRSAQKA